MRQGRAGGPLVTQQEVADTRLAGGLPRPEEIVPLKSRLTEVLGAGWIVFPAKVCCGPHALYCDCGFTWTQGSADTIS